MSLPRRILLSFAILSVLLLLVPNVLGGMALQNHFYMLAERDAHELALQLQTQVDLLNTERQGRPMDWSEALIQERMYRFITDYLLFKEGVQMETGFFLKLSDLQGKTLLMTPNLKALTMPDTPLNQVRRGHIRAPKQMIPVMLYRCQITQQNLPVAELQVAVSMMEYQYVLQRLWRFWLLGCLVAVLATLVLGFFLHRQILAPLVRLTREIQSMLGLKSLRRLQTDDLPPDQILALAESFNTLLQQLSETLERQQRFVSDASHELRSPLTAIQGHAELLIKRGQSNPEILHEGLEVIRKESGRLGRLVEDLLLLARLNHYQPRQERLDLASLAQDVVESRRLLHAEIVFSGSGPVWMTGEANSMRRILINLIDNALRYTPAGTPVQVKVWQNHASVYVQVADQGPGIPQRDVPYIFERFYRIEADRSRQKGGSGLGLPIVKELVDWQQGELELQSDPEQGTVFTMRFPRPLPLA